MLDAVADALRALPAFASLTAGDLALLPAKGTSHGHVRVRPQVEGRNLLARVCYAWPGDADAARRLQVQANAFRHAAASGTTPQLFAVIEPTAALPGGILVVDAIPGRPPRLPHDMAAIADALASIHALPEPPRHVAAALPYQSDPFGETLALVEHNAGLYLDRAGLGPEARAILVDELGAARSLAPQQKALAQPTSFVVTDTHPGNFLIDAAGKAWFVDLEKAMAGGIALDLAHASLYTSTRWDPDVDSVLSPEETRAFYRRYLVCRLAEGREALKPCLLPARRLIWLRTTLFCIRWKVESSRTPDPASALDARMRAHIAYLLADILSAPTMQRIRAEWLENRLVI